MRRYILRLTLNEVFIMVPNWLRQIFVVLTVCSGLFAPSVSSGAVKYRVLHAFGNSGDGAGILAGLALDDNGNPYGTTTGGGAYGEGTVFKLTKGPSAEWGETILHSFCRPGDCSDGPARTGVTLGSAGNLYGSTNIASFEMSPGSNGWSFTVIYDSSSGGLILDNAGNLYGNGGPGEYGYGDVFELSPGSGGWTEQYLYSFHDGSDGDEPFYAPVWGAAGNLYGVTIGRGCGSVFQLHNTSSGWQENVLHNFSAGHGDGCGVRGPVTYNPANGKLYGTTEQGGGKSDFGTVFELSPQKDGSWKETIIHQFSVLYDGAGPGGTLAIDPAGNLYGIAGGGKGPCGGGGCGLVYKLTRASLGKWKYTVLHRWAGPDGALAQAGPTLDSKGNLYGTTIVGGKYGAGVVYEILP